MRFFYLAALAATAFGFGLLLARPKQPFLGTWRSPGGPSVSFQSNGRVAFGFGQSGVSAGRWRDTGAHTLEMQADTSPIPGRTLWQVSEDRKMLVLTNPDKAETVAYLRQ